MIYLSTLLISMFITMALIPILRALSLKVNDGLDYPNPRKVHLAPIPKVGGIAMALGIIVPVWFMAERANPINMVLIGAGVIALFGLIDDVKNLGFKTKFAGQLIAAIVVVFPGGLKICSLGACLPAGTLLPDFLAIPLTIMVIVGVTNAINLSDGLDGLAGGSTMIIFICIGYLAYASPEQLGGIFVVLLCVAIIGSIVGFLRYNTYPATVFMGDTGSQLLGFLAVTLALILTQNNMALSPLLPLLLMGFPVLDTLTVMAERIANGRSPFQADKNHFHHKLMRLGLFHTEAVVAIYFITAMLVALAFILRFYSEWLILVCYLVFAGLVIAGFTVAERKGWLVKRPGFFDILVKGRLKFLKEKQILITTSFLAAEYGLPFVLLVSCLLPADIPLYFGVACLGLAALMMVIWILRKDWLLGFLRVFYYLVVPLILRTGQVGMAAWVTPEILRLYSASFGLLALFMVLTIKFTRRKQGFKATPMDFLILLVALVVPNLPDPQIQSYQMGYLATKIIVMYFSFEVIVGELRGNFSRLAVVALAALLVVAAKGIF